MVDIFSKLVTPFVKFEHLRLGWARSGTSISKKIGSWIIKRPRAGYCELFIPAAQSF